MFGSSLASKLSSLINSHSQKGYDLGGKIQCSFTLAPRDKWKVCAHIITSDPYLGSVNGDYYFYESKLFSDLQSALRFLSNEVSKASAKFSQFQFFRNLEFDSDDKALQYYNESPDCLNNDNWLESALNKNWKSRGVLVSEIYSNGTWYKKHCEEPDELHILTNEINSRDT